MIAEWNVRSDDKVPEPPKIEITVDTESKWTLSEALEEVKENLKNSYVQHVVEILLIINLYILLLFDSHSKI